MTGSKHLSRNLSPKLRHIVRLSSALLGEVIRETSGEALYRTVEALRKDMRKAGSTSASSRLKILSRWLSHLESLSSEKRYAVAHAFSLLMELMNACEAAYRSLHNRQQPSSLKSNRLVEEMVYVLTAHPTESRSPATIDLFFKIQLLLEEAMEKGFSLVQDEVVYWLRLAWHVTMARQSRPEVLDEAQHIDSIVLREDMLRTLLRIRRTGIEVRLRTWVGGDKDGHPGVTDAVMIQSLQASRTRLVVYLWQELDQLRLENAYLNSDPSIEAGIRKLDRMRSSIARLRPGDGRRIKTLRESLRSMASHARSKGLPILDRIDQMLALFDLFPALVIPLELRESSDEIERQLKGPKHRPEGISKMLKTLATTSKGGEIRWYAQAFIVSMVRTARDVKNAYLLSRRWTRGTKLPVVPLLETNDAIEGGDTIVREILDDPALRAQMERVRGGRFEIMLGYSDSAKEMGALPSRLAVAKALRRLDRQLQRQSIRPVFFHGIGGSVARGGGSIEDQTSWWPASARSIFKMTVQGEMVQRSFGSPSIFRRQIEQQTQALAAKIPSEETRLDLPELELLASRTEAEYRALVQDECFLDLLKRGTLYPYLDRLRIGSRPSKRVGTLSVSSLRAIPWVLCWTQGRVLLPVWWGLGPAWQSLEPDQKRNLCKAYRVNRFFRSWAHSVGYTLRKVELEVFELTLRRRLQDPEATAYWMRRFQQEVRAVTRFVREVTGQRDLLYFRPWLSKSIDLRSPMIHPLNLLQILALESKDDRLLRETVTGIASGMLTTG